MGWREDIRKDKDGKETKTKVSYNPQTTGNKAASNDSRTWGTGAQAVDWVQNWSDNGTGLMRGVGLMFSSLPGGLWHTGGIDLDTCRDPATGVLEPWATEIMTSFATYGEVSPSKTGVKLYFLYAIADLPAIAALFNNGKSA